MVMKEPLNKFKKTLKKTAKTINESKSLAVVKSRKWMYAIIISAVVMTALVITVCFYLFIYIKPNFPDPSYNYISSDTADYVNPGGEISYFINYKNGGNKNVDKLEIKLTIPANTSFVSSDTESTIEDGGNTVVLYLDNIGRNQFGKANFIVSIDEPLDNDTSIILDDVVFNYIIKDKKYSQPIISNLNHIVQSSPNFNNFDIKAIDENGGNLHMGDSIEYTITVKNSGNMDATGVKIESTLSKNISIVEGSINNSGNYSNHTVTWNTGNFPADETRTYKFKVTINYDLSDGDLIENSGTLTCDQGIESEKSISDPVMLLPDFSESQIFLTDANGEYLWAGEIINVKMIITNSGEKESDSYRLIFPTPAGATYVSQSGTPEGIRWSDEIRGLIWDLNGIGVKESKEINLQIRVNDDLFYTGGNITTDFKIESGGLETELEQASLGVRKHIYMNIVAMGDSLIARSDWVQRFDQLLESTYPYADYNTVASGVNGEMAYMGFARFDSTVAVHNPQIIIVAYGTNDAGASLSNFSVHLEGIVIKSRNLGATVFLNLIGPLYYPGKDSYPMYNNEILKIAAKYSLPVIDVLTPLSQNPGRYLYNDGVHYTPDGSAVVAQTVFNQVTQYLDNVGQRK